MRHPKRIVVQKLETSNPRMGEDGLFRVWGKIAVGPKGILGRQVNFDLERLDAFRLYESLQRVFGS